VPDNDVTGYKRYTKQKGDFFGHKINLALVYNLEA